MKIEEARFVSVSRTNEETREFTKSEQLKEAGQPTDEADECAARDNARSRATGKTRTSGQQRTARRRNDYLGLAMKHNSDTAGLKRNPGRRKAKKIRPASQPR